MNYVTLRGVKNLPAIRDAVAGVSTRVGKEAAAKAGLYDPKKDEWTLPPDDLHALLAGDVEQVPVGGTVAALRSLPESVKTFLRRVDVAVSKGESSPGTSRETDPFHAGGEGISRQETLKAMQTLDSLGVGKLTVRPMSKGGTSFRWRLHPSSAARVADGELDGLETWDQVHKESAPENRSAS